MKKVTFSLVILLITIVSHAQSVSGEWYGIGSVSWGGEHNNYLSELILQQKGNKVTGEFNYYFKTASITTNVTGTFDPKTRTLEINTHPVLNYQSKGMNGADCPMEGSFTLRISRVESTLTGQFNPLYDYRFTCPAINVKFKKDKPGEKTDITSKLKQVEEPAEIETPLEKIMKEQFAAPPPDTTVEIVAALNKRSFETSDVIEVDADSLKVSLYDNGEVDDDSISLFYNRKLVAHKKVLSTQPLTFVLPVDTSINEIAMYAENLGRFPPNTALAVIYAGDKRYELQLTSTFIKNAAIRFRKKSKAQITAAE